MDKDDLNISEIEAYFNYLIDSASSLDESPIVISKNVFYTNYKNPLPKDIKDMVVVDCSNSSRDFKAYGKQTVLVELYAKEVNGVKNIGKLRKMEKELNKLIEYSKSLDDINGSFKYILDRRGSYSEYEGGIKFNKNIIEIKILII